MIFIFYIVSTTFYNISTPFHSTTISSLIKNIYSPSQFSSIAPFTVFSCFPTTTSFIIKYYKATI